MLEVVFNNIQLAEATGYPITVKYHASLKDILAQFNETIGKDVEKLYNQYGQELPLTYRLQKRGLHVYYCAN